MRDRPFSSVPRSLALALVLLAFGQVLAHRSLPPPRAAAADLPAAPPEAVVRLAALGDPSSLGRILMLWLQAFDNQPGLDLPLARLDYARVAGWLDAILFLEPSSGYPMLAASQLYGGVSAPEKSYFIFDYVHERFLADPDRRWPALAHAAIMAKHRLRDLPLALRYARALAQHAKGPTVPAWARQMEVVILDDLNELEAARVLVGGQLASGQVSSPEEMRFLESRLKDIEFRMKKP